eukprot:scaffold176914_cov30-Tisochrysis_lutea.AAC.5
MPTSTTRSPFLRAPIDYALALRTTPLSAFPPQSFCFSTYFYKWGSPGWARTINPSRPAPALWQGWALIMLAQTPIGRGPRATLPRPRWALALELTLTPPLPLVAKHRGGFGRFPWPTRRAWERQGGPGAEP